MNSELDPGLEARLRELRGSDPVGDWYDVRRRARRARRRTLIVAVAAGILVVLPTVAVGSRLLDVLGITATEERVPLGANAAPIPHVHGDLIYGVGGAPIRLTEPVLAPLLGQEEALAVPAPRWREVVYHAWDGALGGDGTPVLRRIDLRTGVDVVLARGAQSVAIDNQGRVAFMRASRPRYENSPEGTLGGRFGHVVVADALGAPPRVWTAERGEYVVLAWAQQSLLVEARPGPGYVLGVEGAARGIYVLDGPGLVRALPLTGVVAVSADGTRVLGWWSEGDGGPLGTRLVEIATGRVLAQSRLKLARRGAWHGDRVVVSVGGNAQQLAVVKVDEEDVRVERVLALVTDSALRGRFGPFLGSPIFRDDGRSVIMRVASLTSNERPRFVGFLTCEISARACVRGRNLEPPTTWGAVIHNPSRPTPVAERP